MKSKAEVRKVASSEVPIADYIPLGVHMTPNLIKLRTSSTAVFWSAARPVSRPRVGNYLV